MNIDIERRFVKLLSTYGKKGGDSQLWLVETDLSPFCVGQSVLDIMIDLTRLNLTFVAELMINYLTATVICCIFPFRRSQVNIIRFVNALITLSYFHLLAVSVIV